MVIQDLDFGGGHPFPAPQLGQVIGNALIEGSRTIIWPRGRSVEKQDVTFWAQQWQSAGGQGASSYLALRYLLRQLEELAGNPDMQPVFIQWAATAQSGQYNVTTPHDSWYIIENVQPDYANFVVSGLVKVRMTTQLVAPATPSSLSTWYAGGALASTYTGAATALLAFPLGSTGQAPTQLSRTGGEGTVPISVNSTPNPVPFIRPGTIAGLFAGMVRVFDTINTASNPVPTSGGFSHANWVQVYGTQHNWTGDCIVTNGLLLLLFQTGQSAMPSVYCWNTQLGTPAWQQVFSLNYRDSVSLNLGTLREINLDRVGLQEARIRIRTNTSAGNWSELRIKLLAGHYDARVEWQPLMETNSRSRGLELSLATAIKIVANESAVGDVVVDSTPSLTPSSTIGAGIGIGTTANQSIVGWLYQNAPSAGQPLGQNTTLLGIGDANGPAVGSFRTYGIFAVPFATTPNLQAEAESGALGTGWSSVTTSNESNNAAAKVASGTTTGNADLFGTSWVPTAGQYGVPFRMKVASAASSTAQLQCGLWDVTSSAFVSGASTVFAPSQLSTSYVWVFANRRVVTDGITNGTTTVTSATAVFNSTADAGKAISGIGIPAGTTISSVTNATTIVLSQAATTSASGVTLAIGGPITPTAGHNMQWRAVTSGTLGTDFFVDEACLLPILSATLGTDSFPGDIWSQWAFDLRASWARG